ncbi:MAG: T9SS type A sorting domain-containing protein, partial [Chitinophagaceae bacterium]
GATFVDTLAMGVGSPVLNGGNYVYNAMFPSFIADSAHHLVQYRIRVATSAANLYGGCAFFNSARIIVMVNNCQFVLKTDLLSFDATLAGKQAQLKWQTANETDQTNFEVQKSFNGTQFFKIATIQGREFRHSYSFNDPELLKDFAYYRIVVKDPGSKKISNVELLKTSDQSIGFMSVTNPFYDKLVFDYHIQQNAVVTIVISDAHGRTLKSFKQSLVKGANEVRVENLSSLSGGSYILQVISPDGIQSRKLVKLNN